MDNNELLQLILETVTTLKDDVSVLKSDFSVLKDDVSVLKSDVSVLKDDVNVLKDEVQDINTRVTKIETSLETKTNKHIALLVESHSNLVKKSDKLDHIEEDVQDIKMSINVLEAITEKNTYDINKLKTINNIYI